VRVALKSKPVSCGSLGVAALLVAPRPKSQSTVAVRRISRESSTPILTVMGSGPLGGTARQPSGFTSVAGRYFPDVLRPLRSTSLLATYWASKIVLPSWL